MKIYVTTKGKYVGILIDDEDYELIKGMSLSIRNGYLSCSKMKNYNLFREYFHRMVMKPTDGLFVDHINHDRLDNRKCNMRIVTRQQQQQNLRGMNKKVGITSKYKGVCWNNKANKWVAQCRDKDMKQTYLGLFDSEEKAARAYDAFAAVQHGKFGYYNFPEEVIIAL